MKPKQLAQRAIFYLEEAVLDVLLGAKQKGDYVRQVDIEKTVGLYNEWDACHWLVNATLNKLEIEERAEAKKRIDSSGREARIGWTLTDKEYERRKKFKE